MYQFDSRKIQPGDIFICLPGGEPYIKVAKKKGAIDVVRMTRHEMATFARTKFKNPSAKLKVVGITGTNGKTSVSNFVYQALKLLGQNPFVLGTLNSTLTTPESLDTVRLMSNHLAKGGTHFIMEVSSHAIKQERVAEIDFSVRCLTNITQDHLDYHGSFEDYKQTKLSFLKSSSGKSVIPEQFLRLNVPVNNNLIGEFNIENLKATKQILMELGYSEKQINSVLMNVKSPPGRFEIINGDQPFTVVVDYAHTPDSLSSVLKTAKECLKSEQSKLLCLFGCGGDRDRTKRPLMTAAAFSFADNVVITQDNPRNEDPKQIISDILTGLPDKDCTYKVEENRFKAIEIILKMAQKDDLVIIAGKGHETVQLLASGPIEFDDRKVAKLHLKEMGYL